MTYLTRGVIILSKTLQYLVTLLLDVAVEMLVRLVLVLARKDKDQ
jgi:hypothetical protein